MLLHISSHDDDDDDNDGTHVDGMAEDADVEFLRSGGSSSTAVSKAEGFLDLVRAIFRGGDSKSVEPSVQVVSGAAFTTDVDVDWATAPETPARVAAGPLSPCPPSRRAASSRTPLAAASSTSDTSRRSSASAATPSVGIQQRFLELCKVGGPSLTYLRVKKVLVDEYGVQLFQRHREFFVGHLETSSRATATATEKENRTCNSRDPNSNANGEDGGGGACCGSTDSPYAQRASTEQLAMGATAGPARGSHRDLADDVMDPEASATIEQLNHMLVAAKASIAKAMWQEEAYRVYVRNRDRVLVRVLQQAGPSEPLSPDMVQLLLGTLRDASA